MKKLTALLLACMTLVCAAVSCGDKEKDSEKSTETTTASQEEKKSDDKKSDDKKTDDTKSDDDGETDPSQAGAEKIVKKFAETTISNDTESMVSCLYPKSVVDAMKSSGDIDAFAASFGEETLDGKLLDFKTVDVAKLDSKALEGAQQYFSIYAGLFSDSEESFKVVDGYSMEMDATYEANGEKEDINEDVITVFIEGEGWKLIPMTADDLIGLVSSAMGGAESTTSAETAETTETTSGN